MKTTQISQKSCLGTRFHYIQKIIKIWSARAEGGKEAMAEHSSVLEATHSFKITKKSSSKTLNNTYRYIKENGQKLI